MTQILERFAHDAAENRTDHRAGQRSFGYTGRPQVNVVRRGVRFAIAAQRDVGESAAQVGPAASPRQAAEFAVGVVARHAVVAAALDVQRRQIGTPLVAALLKQMVRQLQTQKKRY